MKKIYYTQFNNHRQNAYKRDIEFQFTYEEWVAWWGDDIDKRGKSKGQFVMARNGDIGPYHPDNVRKATCSENVSEGNKGKIVSKETRSKFRLQSSCKPIQTPYGTFISGAEAHRQLGLDMSYYMKTKPAEYYYI